MNHPIVSPGFAGLIFFTMLATFASPPKAAGHDAGVPAKATPCEQATQQGYPAGTPASVGKAGEQEKELKTYSLPSDKYKLAVEYARARYSLYFVSVAYGILVLIFVLRWRLAPRFRDLAESSSSRQLAQVLIYTPLLLLTLGILELPTDIYGQWLSLKYQQSVQSWGSWFWDWTKAQTLGLVLGAFLVWVLYGTIRRSPRRWWFYFWLASIPIIVFLLLIEPVVIDPLFYKFEPLESTQPELVREISKVVERGGLSIPPDRIFEMKASEKLKSLNAYVTGIGTSKRVVVWDTTIKNMTVSETLTVFGHEMGHYVLGHVWKGILFFAGVLFVFLYLGFRGLGWALRRWAALWGVRGADDWASLPVLLLLLSVLMFLASPLVNGFSRYQEHQADVYEVEVIHGLIPNSSRVAARAEQILGEVDLADPDPNPFIKFWLYSHPTQKERVEFELSYDPWSKGQEPEFVK